MGRAAAGAASPLIHENSGWLETPDFQAFRGSEQPASRTAPGLECAKLLIYYGVSWEYEPGTFLLAHRRGGRATEEFMPDFFLPEQALYLEVTVMKQTLVTAEEPQAAESREPIPSQREALLQANFECLAARAPRRPPRRDESSGEVDPGQRRVARRHRAP